MNKRLKKKRAKEKELRYHKEMSDCHIWMIYIYIIAKSNKEVPYYKEMVLKVYKANTKQQLVRRLKEHERKAKSICKKRGLKLYESNN